MRMVYSPEVFFPFFFWIPHLYMVSNTTKIMKHNKIYVEQRPQGDYAVRRAGSERASAVAPTQSQAIERAQELAPGAEWPVDFGKLTQACETHNRWISGSMEKGVI